MPWPLASGLMLDNNGKGFSKMKTESFYIPTYFACAFMYGDCSGLDDADIEVFERFSDDMLKLYGSFNCVSIDAEDAFLKYHDLKNYGVLAANCDVFTFDISR